MIETSGARVLFVIGLSLVAVALVGCGSNAETTTTPLAVQRALATSFATAVLRGDAEAAETLLAGPDEAALAVLVERAAEGWRRQHVSMRSPVRSGAEGWAFGYARRRTHRDGSFEIESGDLVVVVAAFGSGVGVRFFAFDHLRRRISTHHDARLLPSER